MHVHGWWVTGPTYKQINPYSLYFLHCTHWEFIALFCTGCYCQGDGKARSSREVQNWGSTEVLQGKIDRIPYRGAKKGEFLSLTCIPEHSIVVTTCICNAGFGAQTIHDSLLSAHKGVRKADYAADACTWGCRWGAVHKTSCYSGKTHAHLIKFWRNIRVQTWMYNTVLTYACCSI